MARTENTRDPRSKAILSSFSDLLRDNDVQLKRLERLMTLQTPTASDQMIATLLERTVKEGMAKEKEMRDKVEKLVNQLSDPTERYVVRLRYLDLARWEDIGYALFGGNGDYTGFKGPYLAKTFRIHSNALRHLDAVLDAVDRGTITI
ncbi:hypothetical protein [Ruminiclostridium josui]|uniref:hypothetical protein n=1 Tax=Ruminiclostridium josui TaxID=1499 RepID=UPI000463A761|nr:hypothetical protein [Ruminiclostridium josui]